MSPLALVKPLILALLMLLLIIATIDLAIETWL